MALVMVGAGLVLMGLSLLGKLPLGRLPGDIVVRKGGFVLYFPLGTAVVLSAVASFLLWVLRR